MKGLVTLFLCMIFWQAPLCYGATVDTLAPHIRVLGIAQDGGYPHMGCQKQCCAPAWLHDSLRRYVASLALVDPVAKKWWLLEATPDIKYQLQLFHTLSGGAYPYLPAGIFITHAHIGHYTGLMQLGKEALGAREVPVYTLPRLKSYLENNGPWSQLASQRNIVLHSLKPGSALLLGNGISITAFTVPHRDEYSETAGFRIHTPLKKYLFIPDIDKWAKWKTDIIQEVKRVDVALLDGTFNTGTELPGRDISQVPHPFVQESMQLFAQADSLTRQKVVFIHFNHTNPLLWDNAARHEVENKGFRLARQGGVL